MNSKISLLRIGLAVLLICHTSSPAFSAFTPYPLIHQKHAPSFLTQTLVGRLLPYRNGFAKQVYVVGLLRYPGTLFAKKHVMAMSLSKLVNQINAATPLTSTPVQFSTLTVKDKTLPNSYLHIDSYASSPIRVAYSLFEKIKDVTHYLIAVSAEHHTDIGQEQIYHEIAELQWRQTLSVDNIPPSLSHLSLEEYPLERRAHILANVEQIRAFANPDQLTPFHQNVVKKSNVPLLNQLLVEPRENVYAIIQAYFSSDVLEKFKAYEKRFIAALHKQHTPATLMGHSNIPDLHLSAWNTLRTTLETKQADLAIPLDRGDLLIHNEYGLVEVIEDMIIDPTTNEPMIKIKLKGKRIRPKPLKSEVIYGLQDFSSPVTTDITLLRKTNRPKMACLGTPQALDFIEKRATAAFPKDELVYLFAMSEIERRLVLFGDASSTYKALWNDHLGKTQPSIAWKQILNGFKQKPELKTQLKNFILAVHETTGEDLIQIALLRERSNPYQFWSFLIDPVGNRLRTVSLFWKKAISVPLDIQWYYSMKFLREGVLFLEDKTPTSQFDFSVDTYYPTHHPQYEQSSFSQQLLKAEDPFIAKQLISGKNDMIQQILNQIGEVDMVVPIPPRGDPNNTNRAVQLARVLTKQFSLQLNETGLQRIRENGSQKTRSGLHQKAGNASMVFEGNLDLRGKTVLLFDDIRTTGYTLMDARRAAYEAGAKKVYVLTLATTFKKNPNLEEEQVGLLGEVVEENQPPVDTTKPILIAHDLSIPTVGALVAAAYLPWVVIPAGLLWLVWKSGVVRTVFSFVQRPKQQSTLNPRLRSYLATLIAV